MGTKEDVGNATSLLEQSPGNVGIDASAGKAEIDATDGWAQSLIHRGVLLDTS